MRVFLTGGTGYLGGAAAKALVEGGHEVIALARGGGSAEAVRAAGCDPVRGDVTDPRGLRPALGRCEALVHAAALVEAWGPPASEFERVNVRGTLDLLDAARECGIARIVVVSSLFALGGSRDGAPRGEEALDGPPDPATRASRYAWSKAVAARAVAERQRAGLPAILVFPTVLLGPGALTRGNHTARILADLRARRLPGLVGDGTQVWNLVGVADVGRGIVRALSGGRPGGRYILGGEDWTQERLVRRASELLGVRPPLSRLGTAIPLAVAFLSELGARVSGHPPLLTRGEVRLYDRHWAYASDRARADLGWDPAPVDRVLQETVTWLRETVWKTP